MEDSFNESLEAKPKGKHNILFKKSKRKKCSICLLFCLVLLAGFFVFAHAYQIPLPFDSYRMSIEAIPSAVVVGKDGRTSWVELKSAMDHGLVSDNDKNVINVLNRNYQGINGISESSVGRTVKRDDNNVRVVYYCYTKSIWDSLFIDSDLQIYSESGRSTGTDIYGDNYQSMDYKPQMVEIYYLPRRNLYEIDRLSDVEYDRLKENCELIWNGII